MLTQKLLYLPAMKISLLLFALALSVGSRTAQAQTTAGLVPGSVPTVTITPSQRQAAEALLNTIYSEASFNELIGSTVTAQLKLHPELRPHEEQMRAFMQKYMGWAALKPDMVQLYAQEFTEPELVEMTRFYQSPVGKKAASKLPVMMQKGMEIGQRQVQAHLPELQKIFSAKAPAHESHGRE